MSQTCEIYNQCLCQSVSNIPVY